jgi:hypothetical protein
LPLPEPSTYPVADMTIHYADYPENWQPLANDAADSSFRGNPMSAFYEGGRVGTKPVRITVPKGQNYAKGGLAKEAQRVRDAGVGGDELIIHINRDEFEQLKKHWGEPTINPNTGMPQFTPFWKQDWFAPVAAIGSAALMATGVGAPLGAALLPEALAGSTIAGAALPSVLGNALIGTGVGALTGGSKGALLGGALGGIGTIGAGALGSTAAGVTSTGQEGMSGWWSRMGDGNYFTLGAAGTPGAATAATALGGNPAAVGPTGPVVPPGMTLDAAARAPHALDAALPKAGLLGGLMDSKWAVPAALLGVSALAGAKPKSLPQQGATGAPSSDPNLTQRLDLAPLSRPRLAAPTNYYTYGFGPETTYYDQPVETKAPVQAAMGGALSRYVEGGGTGRSDSIDAKLSDGEYVIDAETVSLLGDGSSKAGAKRLDQFRANVRKQKGRELAKGKFSPDAKRPEEYI